MIGLGKLWRKFTLRDGAAFRAFFGGGSTAGQNVTASTTMGLTSAWSCIRLIAQTGGTLPFPLYEKVSDDERKRASGHWLDEILTVSPNADQTPAEFFEGVFGCLALRGVFYARKAGLRANGEFAAAETMFPDSVTKRREGQRIVYDWVDPWGRKFELPENEVLEIRGFGLGGEALSPLAYARETLGAAMAAEASAARFFGAGMQPSGFLEVPQELDQKQREELDKIMSQYVGSKNAGKLMILEAGMKFSPLAMKPDDAELLLTRRFNVEEVCRIFGVPPILIGHSPEGQTMWGSGVEQIMLAWLTLGLRPYLVRIEQAIRKRALPAAERARFYPEFVVEGLLRADSAGRAALYASFAQNGILTRNELRKLENRGPLPGGDELTVQSNLVFLKNLGEAAIAGDQQAKATLRAWLGLEGDTMTLPDLRKAA